MNATSKAVWRKGWQREAAATQAASTKVAAFIGLLEQRGYAAEYAAKQDAGCDQPR
jgi:predicted kinase